MRRQTRWDNRQKVKILKGLRLPRWSSRIICGVSGHFFGLFEKGLRLPRWTSPIICGVSGHFFGLFEKGLRLPRWTSRIICGVSGHFFGLFEKSHRASASTQLCHVWLAVKASVNLSLHDEILLLNGPTRGKRCEIRFERKLFQGFITTN